jgi:hypothetical protein
MTPTMRDVKRYRRCFSTGVIFVVMLMSHGRAQEAKPVVLEHADDLIGREINGEHARELTGHVRIRQEQVIIECDRAMQYIARGEIELVGHVTVRDDSVTITTPRGMYHQDARVAEGFDGITLDDGRSRLKARYGKYFVNEHRAYFEGKVTARDSTSTLVADSVWYFRSERRTLAMGGVIIHTPADRMMMRGGRFEHDASRGFSRMSIAPMLVQFDTAASGAVDTLLVRSVVMESYEDSVRRLLAIDSVRFVRGDVAGIAGVAHFESQRDSIALRKAPVLWYQRTQIRGDSINVRLHQRKLDRIIVLGSAFAVSQSDSTRPLRFEQLTGETMVMQFAEKALSRIDVEVRATSVYYVYEDSLPNGLNKTSGDRVTMAFANGKVESIQVSGGVEGQYFPENLVRNREQTFNLPGFVWREDRPRLVWLHTTLNAR